MADPRNEGYVREKRPLRVDVTVWNRWRRPRLERYADGATAMFFGIGKVSWWR